MTTKLGGRVPITRANERTSLSGASKIKPTAPKGRKLSSEEIAETVKKIVDEIYNNYSYEACLLIVPSAEDIPLSLHELLEGSGIGGIAVWNLPLYYHDYQAGRYDAYQFLCDVEALLNELSREFAEIVEMFAYRNYEGKGGNEYERS